MSSPTLELAERIGAARATGRKVLSASTPVWPVANAPISTLTTISRKMGEAVGALNLRTCLARELFSRWQASPEDLLITSGAKAGLLIVLATLIDRECKLGVITPFWPTYEALAGALGITTVRFAAENKEWSLNYKTITDALSPGDGLILSNPSNPTGRVYSSDEITALANKCREKGVWLILDESFSETIDPDVSWSHPISILGDQIVVINSISKNFLSQGFRIGAIYAAPVLLQRLAAMQLSLLSPPALPMQELTHHLITNGVLRRPDLTSIRIETYERLIQAGFSCYRGQGSYYLYPRIRGIARDREMLEREVGLYILNGTVFGDPDPDRVRICILQDPNELNQILSILTERFGAPL